MLLLLSSLTVTPWSRCHSARHSDRKTFGSKEKREMISHHAKSSNIFSPQCFLIITIPRASHFLIGIVEMQMICKTTDIQWYMYLHNFNFLQIPAFTNPILNCMILWFHTKYYACIKSTFSLCIIRGFSCFLSWQHIVHKSIYCIDQKAFFRKNAFGKWSFSSHFPLILPA